MDNNQNVLICTKLLSNTEQNSSIKNQIRQSRVYLITYIYLKRSKR